MSSSVFPLYMLPTMTSIQPWLGRWGAGSAMAGGRYRRPPELSTLSGRPTARRPARKGLKSLMRRGGARNTMPRDGRRRAAVRHPQDAGRPCIASFA